jgi:hypothetical protein
VNPDKLQAEELELLAEISMRIAEAIVEILKHLDLMSERIDALNRIHRSEDE